MKSPYHYCLKRKYLSILSMYFHFFAYISTLEYGLAFILINTNLLFQRILCVDYSWNYPSGSGSILSIVVSVLSMFFLNCLGIGHGYWISFAKGCFFLLLILGLSSHSRIFHSYGDVTITGEGLQILTYARHSPPSSSDGSLACHTYFDTGHPFIMVISEDPWHSHLLPSVWQWSCRYRFLRLSSVAAVIRTHNLTLAGQRFNPLRHCRRPKDVLWQSWNWPCGSRECF